MRRALTILSLALLWIAMPAAWAKTRAATPTSHSTRGQARVHTHTQTRGRSRAATAAAKASHATAHGRSAQSRPEPTSRRRSGKSHTAASVPSRARLKNTAGRPAAPVRAKSEAAPPPVKESKDRKSKSFAAASIAGLTIAPVIEPDPAPRPVEAAAKPHAARSHSSKPGAIEPEPENGVETAELDQFGSRKLRQTRLRRASLSRAAMPAPLKGSYESLVHQNTMTQNEGLDRIDNQQELDALIASRELVPVPAGSGLIVDGNLAESMRNCRPWTAKFLTDLARLHEARFHKAFTVSSAVRTVEYQKKLELRNGNAAPAEGDVVSPHLTGATIDIAKSGMTREEIGWMRTALKPLQDEGKLDVEEEFRQACFHITVYKSYAPPRPAAPSRARRKADPPPDSSEPAAAPGEPADGDN